MKKILSFLTVLIISLGLSLHPAEAKRLGAGQSMGQQKQSFARKASPPSAPTSATAGAAATGTTATATSATSAASGTSKWLGPLAGLAAGGLLAALLFGDAFKGLQVMDMLLIALFAFGVYMLIRMLRAKAAQAQQQPAGYQYAAAGGAPYGTEQPLESAPLASSDFDRSRTALSDAPAWFDEHRFLQSARHHFLILQMAWDANDMEKVREYFTPDMFEQLRAQRAEIGDNNTTDVQSLDAQLLDLVREGNQIIASVLFQGRVRENGNMPEDIAEVWHIQHVADTPQGDWLISGIQQVDPRTLH